MDREEKPQTGDPGRFFSIRLRGVLICLLAVPVNVFIVVRGNWTGYGVAAVSMVAPAVAGIFALAVLNRLLQRRWPRWVLSAGELIAIYAALGISTGLCASVIAWPAWNATPGNRWEELLLPNLPSWLLVTDRSALAGFFLGDASPYRRSVLTAWLGPALWWTAWAAALLWVTLCLNVIVRRRWSQEEQLPFPMTMLPLQMSQEKEGLLQSPLFWVGVAASALIGVNQAVSRVAPAMPVIPTGIDYGAWVANNKPWNAIRIPHFNWGPWELGLAYLMPLELAFSLVVFNLFWRAELITSRQLGWSVSSWGGFPYGEQQVMGAYLALGGIFLWLERRYLLQVIRKALGLPSYADDSEEAFSYRTAVLGAVMGLAFLSWFLARAGMAQAVVALFLPGYFLMVMMISRLRAQLGPPSNEMWGTMPDFALAQYPGTQALGPRTLAMLALLQPYLREQTANPAPVQLEALRMAQVLKLKPGRLALLMAAIVPFGVLTYFWASLHVGSHLGLGSGKVHESMIFHAGRAIRTMEDWLTQPAPPDWGGVAATAVGFGVVIVLMVAKIWFPLWPLHPVAFPLGYDMVVDDMLPALALTWLVKSLLLRYGGLRAYRKALKFFLGLIVGAASVSMLRYGFSMVFGVPL